MRWIITYWIVFFCCCPTFCETLRVSTWNMQWFPSGSANPAAAELEQQRIQEAASLLKEVVPDVLLVQEIRDWKTSEDLVEALKPESYHVLVCSAFKDEFSGT